MQQMEPHGRLRGRIVSVARVELGGERHFARGGCDCSEIQERLDRDTIDLRFLNGQIVAGAVAMVFARGVRVIAWLTMVGLAGVRVIAACIIIIMRVMPAATDRSVNEQRCGDQAGKNGTHKNSI
jgi:hypothetical protein